MAAIQYPAALPGPQPGDLQPASRRAASSQPGPLQLRGRQRDFAGAVSQHTFVYTAQEMEIWRDWYSGDLLDGRRWFFMELPGAGGLVPRAARYLAFQEALLGRGIYRVTATLEQRGAAAQSASTGGDPYWGNVVLLLHGDGVNGSTTFTDSSQYGRSVLIAAGTPTVSTEHFKFGTGSIVGNPTTSRIYTSFGAEGASAQEWTWECFLRRSGSNDYHGLMYTNNSNLILALKTGVDLGSFELMMVRSGTEHLTGATPLALDTWYHLAVTRRFISGLTYRTSIWVDGIEDAFVQSEDSGAPLSLNTGLFEIGRANSAGFSGLGNFIDEYRVTVGVARYTAPFTPPDRAFPNF